MMKNTKCKHCIEGVVFSPDCERIVANRYCEIDEYTEGVTSCTECGCHYYQKRKESGVADGE